MPVELVVIWTGCSHRYSSFPLEASHRACSLCLNLVQRTEVCFYVRASLFLYTQIWYNYVIIIIIMIIVSCPWQCAFHVLTGCPRPLQYSVWIQASHEFVRETQLSKAGILVSWTFLKSVLRRKPHQEIDTWWQWKGSMNRQQLTQSIKLIFACRKSIYALSAAHNTIL